MQKQMSRSSAIIQRLIEQARQAQWEYERLDQEAVDDVVTALAWALTRPENNRRLSEMAVRETGLGRVEDKIQKNRRKTLGLLRDLQGVQTVGVVSEDPNKGLIEIARPVGVVGALTPATNPVATPTNVAMNALKGQNAVIFSPSPKAHAVCAELLALFQKALRPLNAPSHLLQLLPAPITRQQTKQLMLEVDLVMAAGSANNVRAAYQSGTPAIGVGKGNVPVIIDSDARLEAAAQKIAQSKTFDYATSCSSENSLVILEAVYSKMLHSLESEGGVILTEKEKKRLAAELWQEGQLNRELVARPLPEACTAAGLERDSLLRARFLMVKESGVGPEYPFSGEKLSPVLTLYRAQDFEEALGRVQEILAFQGLGHSCGIHTDNPEHVLRLGQEVKVCRVIVNQAHCFANGGNFDNGLPFTLSMGCGTWGGDISPDNINYRHYLNTTRIAYPFQATEPSEDELFGSYHAKYAR